MNNDIKLWFVTAKNFLRKGANPQDLHKYIEIATEEISEEQKSDRDFLENFDVEELLSERNKKIMLKNIKKKKETLSQKIASKLSILDVADQFGIKPLGKKLRVCPFHSDNKPSLSLGENRGLFNCFSCHSSGNIIKFIYKLKQINPDFELELGGCVQGVQGVRGG